MDGRMFDEMTRAIGTDTSGRVVLKRMAGDILGGLAALVGRDALVDTDKIIICHKSGTPAEQTKEVAVSALSGHLGHGDYIGACGSGGDGAGDGLSDQVLCRWGRLNYRCCFRASRRACRRTSGQRARGGLCRRHARVTCTRQFPNG